MYNDYQTHVNECDECITKGICSVNPTLNSIQEIILLYLKELSFYLLKLKDFGVTNDNIRDKFLAVMSNIVSNAEYNQNQFYKMVSELHEDIEQSKILYENFCQKNQMDIETVKTYFKKTKKFELTDAIKKGEKYFLKKAQNFTAIQKDIFDIMLFLTKSVGIKMLEAKQLDIDFDEAYYATLSMFNAMNFANFTENAAQEEIKKYIMIYYDIVREVFHKHISLYGKMKQVEVPFSTEKGKAILVSGTDITKLEAVLNAVQNTKIMVYTHGLEFLMAHCHEKFQKHPNLKGHFGKSMDSSLIDFAAFPGSILMTKTSLQSIEYLYRGRLYTFDEIPPKGVVKLTVGNLEPLIKSALDAKGFSKDTYKPSVKAGFNIEDVREKTEKVIEKIINKEIKNLYFIGILNFENTHKSYFEKFCQNSTKEDYFISLSFKNKTNDNFLNFDSFGDYSLFYFILNILKKRFDIKKLNITVFLTKCDKHTIANLIYLREIGIKHIFMCKCPSSLINPALINNLQKLYNIDEFSDPLRDYEITKL